MASPHKDEQLKQFNRFMAALTSYGPWERRPKPDTNSSKPWRRMKPLYPGGSPPYEYASDTDFLTM